MWCAAVRPWICYMACDGRHDRLAMMQIALEEASVRKADFVFAPSRLTASHYSRKLDREMAVLPTPVYLEVSGPEGDGQGRMPARYLLHFAGIMMARKGTDLVAQALPLALSEAPDLTMIWVGQLEETYRQRLLAPLGAAAAQVICLPPQDKATLYGLIRGAVCAVLPSRIDNLSNTVLESLMLGTPVIGSRDSSIEELVKDGVTGVLIPNGSAPDLAAAMVRAWRGDLDSHPGGRWPSTALGRAFRPEIALTAYLEAVSAARDRLVSHQP